VKVESKDGVGGAIDWASKPVFEPMWGASQWSDQARLRRLVMFFEAAFGVEARRLMREVKPHPVERMWEKGWHIWGATALFCASWAWLFSRSQGGAVLMMATTTLMAWTVALCGLLCYLAPCVIFGLDPTRPNWARRGAPLDPAFALWLAKSFGALSESDRAQAGFLLPGDAKSLHDVWLAMVQIKRSATDPSHGPGD
jgi:hypothetical protein